MLFFALSQGVLCVNNCGAKISGYYNTTTVWNSNDTWYFVLQCVTAGDGLNCHFTVRRSRLCSLFICSAKRDRAYGLLRAQIYATLNSQTSQGRPGTPPPSAAAGLPTFFAMLFAVVAAVLLLLH